MIVLSNNLETAEFALGAVQLTDRLLDGTDDREAWLWRGARPMSPDGAILRGSFNTPPPEPYVLAIVDEAAGSQFDALVTLLRQGRTLPDACATVALSGSNFHGQRNRDWIAHKGNLHLCVYYRADIASEEVGVGFTMVPAVAVADTIRSVCGSDPRIGIKWVNDVRVDRHKVSGVLTATQTSGRNIDHVVFGVGVNIGVTPDLDPSSFVPQVTCLRTACGEMATLPAILPHLLAAIDRRYRQVLHEGPELVFQAYASYLEGVGEEVAIYPEDPNRQDIPLARGILRGIHPDLSLSVEGQSEPIRHGRMVLAKTGRGEGA